MSLHFEKYSELLSKTVTQPSPGHRLFPIFSTRFCLQLFGTSLYWLFVSYELSIWEGVSQVAIGRFCVVHRLSIATFSCVIPLSLFLLFISLFWSCLSGSPKLCSRHCSLHHLQFISDNLCQGNFFHSVRRHRYHKPFVSSLWYGVVSQKMGQFSECSSRKLYFFADL